MERKRKVEVTSWADGVCGGNWRVTGLCYASFLPPVQSSFFLPPIPLAIVHSSFLPPFSALLLYIHLHSTSDSKAFPTSYQ